MSVLIPPLAIFSLIYTFRLGEVSPETWEKIDARLEEVYGKAAPEAYPPKEEIQAYTNKIASSALLEHYTFSSSNWLSYPDLSDIVVEDRAYHDDLTSRILEASKQGFAEEHHLDNGSVSLMDSNRMNLVITRHISLVKSIELNNTIITKQEESEKILRDLLQLFSLHNPRTSFPESYSYRILISLMRNLAYCNKSNHTREYKLDTQLTKMILSESIDKNILVATYFRKNSVKPTTKQSSVYRIFQEHVDLHDAIKSRSVSYDNTERLNSPTWTHTAYYLSKTFSSDSFNITLNEFEQNITSEISNDHVTTDELRILATRCYLNYFDLHNWDYVIKRSALLLLTTIHTIHYTREMGNWPNSFTDLDTFISSKHRESINIKSMLTDKDTYLFYYTPVASYTKNPIGNYTSNFNKAAFIRNIKDIFSTDLPIFRFSHIQLNDFSITSSDSSQMIGHTVLESRPFDSSERCFHSPFELLSYYFQLRDNRLYVIKADLFKKQVDAAGEEVWYTPNEEELKIDIENLYAYCSRTETSKYGITETEKALLPHLQNLQYRLEVEFKLPKQMLAIYTSNAGPLTEEELLSFGNDRQLREKEVNMTFLPPPGFSARPLEGDRN